jgi:hypothetical protein
MEIFQGVKLCFVQAAKPNMGRIIQIVAHVRSPSMMNPEEIVQAFHGQNRSIPA